MNLTDRIYFAVHALLTLLVCVRHDVVVHWPRFIAWNVAAMLAIVVLARKRSDGEGWEFAHDFLPAAIFFTSVFEEISFLSLSLVGTWQDHHIAAGERMLFAVAPAMWLRQHLPRWAVEFLAFGYFAFYPMYPAVGVPLWIWRRRSIYEDAFRHMTDAVSVGYIFCYITYLVWPTRSPVHAAIISAARHHGPFSWLVGLIQRNGGVHGNAFPSGHIMLAFVLLVFVQRYFPKLAPWFLAINVLMCLGAVYDGYHWASDVVVGAAIGTAAGAALLVVTQGWKPGKILSG